MYTLLMILFVFLCLFLALFILLQQGKGDLGVGSMQGSQMLFGGSGGQGFFEKATWGMGILFILGSLGLSILKSRQTRSSILEGVTAQKNQPVQPVMPQAPMQTEAPVTDEAEKLSTTKTAQDDVASTVKTSVDTETETAE